MIGIFKKPLTRIEALKKYNIDNFELTEGQFKKYMAAISSEYTLPKKVLEKSKEYTCNRYILKFKSAFL